MTARLRATLLAAALFVAFTVALFVQPTGYSLLSPGPTVDVLGSNGSAPIITIKGHQSYPDTGQLRMLTVIEMPPGQSLSLTNAIHQWLADGTSVYPSDFLYQPGTTACSADQEGASEMTSAQDLAKAAALRQAGISVPTTSHVGIVGVSCSGPSYGKLQVGDVLVSVAGHPVASPQQAVTAVRAYKPGDLVPIVILRGGKSVSMSIRSIAAGSKGVDATRPRIGVTLALSQQFRFPFPITINIPDSIMGPSAGMMFALTIYDKLTPGSLTHGHDIAGTGTIDASGAVGPIGGIAQKVRGAQRDGAQLFLAPASNCDELRHATYDHATMRVVKVSTLAQAIKAVETWTAHPDAALPGC
ncbi:MAG: YlbL family protein [Marmoricola sp.]